VKNVLLLTVEEAKEVRPRTHGKRLWTRMSIICIIWIVAMKENDYMKTAVTVK